MLTLIPRIQVMTKEQREKVHKDALFILKNTGIVVEDHEARTLFTKAIGSLRKDRHVRIPEDIIQWAIESAPSSIQIYDRLGNLSFELQGDGNKDAVFGIGVTNLNYQDPTDTTISPFHRKHMALAAGLGHNLENFDFISTPGVIQDLPPENADLHGVLEMVANTTKPLVMLISNPDCFLPALDLCDRFQDNISSKPFVIPYVNPITPLILNSETTMKMAATIHKGLPLIFSNYGMSGATCPITAAGTLALLVAELLAGLVYSQLVKEGAPVILGSLPAAFDMKNAGSFYSPTTLVLNLACAEMMKSYNIPHCGTSGSGNGWGADLLASTTMCFNHITSALSSVGMVPFVGGNFDSLVFSPELVVFSDDIIHQARLFTAGFSLADDDVGFEDISKVGPGGNFLMSELTGKHFRDSQFSSTIWPFLTLDKWKQQGAPRAAKMLTDKTCALLDNLTLPEDHDDVISQGEAFLTAY